MHHRKATMLIFIVNLCVICRHLKHKGDYEKKVEVFQNIVSEVDAALKRGEGFPLSSLRDRAKISFPIEN